MQFESQPIKLPIVNFDSLVQNEKKETQHGHLLPNSVRAIFCGPSNCGKTNALLTLLIHPNGLRFENVYVYLKSLNQPNYNFLEKVLELVNGVEYYSFNEHEDVIIPSEAHLNSVFIFDDVACEKLDNIKEFFFYGQTQGC